MVSLKLAVFLTIALAYAASVHSDDEVLDVIKDQPQKILNQTKQIVETQTEKKGLFDSFKEKVSGYYDTALKKSKEALEATADVVSDGYNKIKDQFVDKSTESPKTLITTIGEGQI